MPLASSSSQHLAATTRIGDATGTKRSRRRSSHNVPTISDSACKAMDEAAASSDSVEEQDVQKQQGLKRPRKKRQKSSVASPGHASHEQPMGKKTNTRRNLAAPIDWSDRWWETQKMPVDLVQAISLCKETKSSRSHTDPCPVLSHVSSKISKLGIHWIHGLKCFYCVDHSRLIPGDGFRCHFGGRIHQQAFPGTTRYIFFTASAFHLAICYPDMQNQSYEQLKCSLPTQLPQPLPLNEGSHSFEQRYKCTYINPQSHKACSTWVSINKSRGAKVSELRRHTSQTHQVVLKEDIPISPQWTQQVGVGQGSGANGNFHYFTFPETFLPLTQELIPVFSTVDHAAPLTDTWAASLGWEDYINQLIQVSMPDSVLGSHQKVVKKLRDLVSLPNHYRVSVSNQLQKILEHGLLHSNRLNLSYLEDAATWVSLMHSSFQNHFKHGGCVQQSPLCNQSLILGCAYPTTGRNHFSPLPRKGSITSTEKL